MQFPTEFPFLVIPTGAGPGQQRITINYNQDGKIKVYDSAGHLVDALGGAQGQFILYDSSGNMVVSLASTAGIDDFTGLPFQAGITTYTSTTAINLFGNDGTWTASNGSKIVVESATEASIFLTPHNGPWNAASISTGLVGSPAHPFLFITSPADTTNDIAASILIQGSSSASPARDIALTAETIEAAGIFSANNIAVGHTTITPSAANTPTSVTVTFGPLDGTSFRGFCNPTTTVPGTQVTGWSVTGVSATQATVTVTRTNTTATGIDYMIWAT